MASQFALAIIVVDGRYALQLRDDKSGISCPGMWGLFGGKIERDEKPKSAIIREVAEELGIKLRRCRFLRTIQRYNDFEGKTVQYWLFTANISHEQWERHKLNEGQDANHFAFDELCDLCMPPLIREVLECHYRSKWPGSGKTEYLKVVL